MNLNEKSRIISFLLTLFFGPLGLLYSSVLGGVVLAILAIVTAATVVGPIVCWIVAICVGDHCTYKHNQNVQKLTMLLTNEH